MRGSGARARRISTCSSRACARWKTAAGCCAPPTPASPPSSRLTARSDPVPKTPADRLEWFRSAGTRYPILVAEEPPPTHPPPREAGRGQIRGWTRLYAWSVRCAYDRAAELGVYVHAQQRGKGVG